MNFAVEHTVNLLKINLGINDLKKEREHVKNLIIKTDERIDKLMRELRKTEPKTQESTHNLLPLPKRNLIFILAFRRY